MTATKILLAVALFAASHTYAATYSEPESSGFHVSLVSKASSFAPDSGEYLTSTSSAPSSIIKPGFDIEQALNDVAANIGKPDFPFDIEDDPAPGCGCGAPPPVPVPAAVWLMSSGLLGLACVARRKALNAA